MSSLTFYLGLGLLEELSSVRVVLRWQVEQRGLSAGLNVAQQLARVLVPLFVLQEREHENEVSCTRHT